jgi:hypothetical protein
MDFDLNKYEKVGMYHGIWFMESKDAADIIAKIYYEKEIHMDPCYWHPPGWQKPPLRKELIRQEPGSVMALVKKLADQKNLENAGDDHGS